MHNALREKLRDTYGAQECKHSFTYYKNDYLIACPILEVIDHYDGFYINFACKDCEDFEFDGDVSMLLDGLDDLEDTAITEAMIDEAIAEIKARDENENPT